MWLTKSHLFIIFIFKRKNMTLDEAIQHCEESALCGDICGLEHKPASRVVKRA